VQGANIKLERLKALSTLAIALATLGLFIVSLGGHRFWESMDSYVVRFDTVKDLRPGRPVKYAGLDVGRVLAIDVDKNDPGKVAVTLGVLDQFTLYQGTEASISQKGLVGDNYVLLMLHGPAGPVLEPGAEIPGVGTPSMAEVAEKIGRMVDDIAPKINRVAESLEAFVNKENGANLSTILAEAPGLMRQTKATLERIEKDWKNVSENAVKGIDEGRQTLDQVSKGLDQTLGTINTALLEVTDNWNTTMQLVQTEVRRAGNNMENLSGQLEETVAYDQERLEEVLENINLMTRDLKMLSRSLRERPWQLIHKTEGRPLE